MFDGNPVEIQVGTGSTLYITNFLAIADEAYIRDLFGKVSEIPIQLTFLLICY